MNDVMWYLTRATGIVATVLALLCTEPPRVATTLDGKTYYVALGERVSYGLRHELDRATTVVTVPIGYADGVPRRLSLAGGEVLVHGQRFPIVGVVTMDQLMVDVGDLDVAVGDEVVLLGAQADPDARHDDPEVITADEWAGRIDTIAYEVVCGIGPRVPRFYRR